MRSAQSRAAPCKTCKHLGKPPTQTAMGRTYDMCTYPIGPMPAALTVMLGRIDIPYNRFVLKDMVEGYAYNGSLQACPCYEDKHTVNEAQKTVDSTPGQGKVDTGPDPNLAAMLKSFTNQERADVKLE